MSYEPKFGVVSLRIDSGLFDICVGWSVIDFPMILVGKRKRDVTLDVSVDMQLVGQVHKNLAFGYFCYH